ncbi:MAG: beta-ketoacyl-[acyl-carrier-protein] synthase family protein [Chromatiaceae bacterium]|nr:beta-ketoacyl-[acyl-carrier-protein] synthase family protein [Chromatiaceae bacterium]
MKPLAISAYTVTNALGRGTVATIDALRRGESGLRPEGLRRFGLDTWVGPVDGLEDLPLVGPLARYDCRNHRLAWLGMTQDGFQDAVQRAMSRYGATRVGLFLGTSTSGIAHAEHCYRQRAAERTRELDADLRFPYTQPMHALGDFCRDALGIDGPTAVLSTACSSSAKAFATAYRHIATGICDAAVVGGVDSLCVSTLYGFNALGLLAKAPCAPWGVDRKGINIGEAASFALLERAPGTDARVALLGYGESSDGYHMSSPRADGRGAVSAMTEALESAGLQPGDIDYINLHGTATSANDKAEDAAVCRVFPDPPAASSTKGWTGHTLGAAGITEAVVCFLALEQGILPATLGCRSPDPVLSLQVLTETQSARPRRVLSNSFGFGGSNCTLVFGSP